ncbi:MAG: hypothetical protein B7Y99_02960 [Caulobacterales bacterium 32-69-10]|nr:MAG: hypothetical protein B7Y99_02960 [Caulobacterales bacterium 32-69-10]
MANATGGYLFGEPVTHPPFGVKSVRICNVGAIDDLYLDIPSGGLMAIYAGNGVGKTTVLESISTLGHLPCFPSVSLGKAVEDSLLVRALGHHGDKSSALLPLLDLASLPKLGLNIWLEKVRPGKNAGYGCIEFEVFDTLEGGAAATHRFVLFICSAELTEPVAPTLTRMLSRGHFDDLVADISFNDDRVLGHYGLIVYGGHEQIGQTFPDLVRKLAKGRTFSTVEEREGKLTVVQNRLDLPDHLGPRSVSYINTDLNDFGRGNDLRESPKDLKRDFGLEMYERLRIELDRSGHFKHLAALGEVCNRVLSTPYTHYADLKAIPSSFRLSGLHSLDGEGEFAVAVDREDGAPPIPIEFLSAGENEVFFITLMMLNLTRNPSLGHSIILLDEPDLHVANVALDPFFKSILDLAIGRSQVILSSHSAALYEHIRRRFRRSEDCVRVIFRRVLRVDPLQTVLRAEFDEIFLGKLRSLGFRGGFWTGVRSRFLINAGYHKRRIESLWDKESQFTWLALGGWMVATIMAAALVANAVLNDAINDADLSAALRKALFFDKEAAAYHDVTRGPLIGSLIAVFGPLLGLMLFRVYRHRQHKRMLGEVREKYQRHASGASGT